jgi:uncharacterized protein YbjT (DUF2867 family)
MRVLVLGVTGGVGRHVVTQTLAAGHQVSVLVRASAQWEPVAGVRAVRGALLEDGPSLDEAMQGAQAVLCSVGMQRKNPANPYSKSVSPADLTSSAAARIVASMKRQGVARVVAVSAAGVAESAARLNLPMRFLLATTMIGDAYADLAKMEATFASSGLDWLAPRPTRLVDGPETKRLKVVESFGVRDAISRADVAGWMVRALSLPTWPLPDWKGRTPQVSAA